MLIDSNLVLSDSVPLTATGTSSAVALTSFFKAGKAEPLPFVLRVTEDFAGLTSLAVKLTESDTAEGVYSDVPGANLTLPLASLKCGKNLGWRVLPATVTKAWLRLAYTLTGTPTAGKIFAALTRDADNPYESDMCVKG